jgi:beta-lactamase regulating signal transducer with metallopeptidase domain
VPAGIFADLSPAWHLADFSTLALGIWCAGALIGLVRLSVNVFAAAALARRSICQPLPAHFQNLLPLDLRESDEVQDPIVIGLLRPCVIVPTGLFDRHDAAGLQAVLAHEKSHIHRADPMAALLQRIIVVIFWWNPLLRVLSRHIDDSREMACDEAAVRRLGSAQDVARALTEFVHQRHHSGEAVHSLGLGSAKALFTRRIRRLLEEVEISSPRIRALVMVPLCAVIAGIVVATPRSQAATPPQASTTQAGTALAGPTAQPDRATPSLLSAAIAQQDSDMLRRLIRAGADVRAAEARGERLLLSAVQADNTGMVEALVRAGADARAAQARGEPVLAEAVRRGNSGIARLLLHAGARPD